MDMRDLEAEVQRLVGYKCLVTSGVTEKGPYINFNAGGRLLRIWIPRTGYKAERIAEQARGYLEGEGEPAFKEIDYQPAQ